MRCPSVLLLLGFGGSAFGLSDPFSGDQFQLSHHVKFRVCKTGSSDRAGVSTLINRIARPSDGSALAGKIEGAGHYAITQNSIDK